MLYKKSLIASAALLSGSFLLPANAVATSCPSSISGTALAGEICTFDATNSVTVSSGAVLGGINQTSYNPTSSFILNNGTITNEADGWGINISDSSLSNGLTNNGIISIGQSAGILINDSSTISGGISNSGSITSAEDMGFQFDAGSIINGNFTNSGSIISNSINNPAILFRDSTMNGDVINSGIVRADGIGNGILMTSLGGGNTINGDIINSGTISAGGSGLALNWTNVSGGITNSGSITSSSGDGLAIINGSQLQDGIANSGTISGNDNGIRLEGSNVIFGGIVNGAGATITGTAGSGIYINDNSPVFANIKNYGTISGSIYGIFIHTDSNSGAIDTYEGSTINGAIDAQATVVNFHGGTINGTMNVRSLNIDSGSIFNMTHSITVEAGHAVTNAGTIKIGDTTQTINGDYIQSTGGLLKIDAQNTSNYGQLVVTGAVNLSQSGAIDVNVVSGASIVKGNILSNVISGNTFTTPTGGFSISDNSRLLNFNAVMNGGNNGVNLLVVDDAGTSISQSNSAMGNRSGAGAAAKLDEIIVLNPGGDWQNVISAFNKLGSDQEIANAVSQTTPALLGATNGAITETMSTAMRIVQARTSSNFGLSSGDDIKESRNLWIKTFGSFGKQGNEDGVVGYDSNAYGFIAGQDKNLTDTTNLGFGFSYYNSKLTSNNNYNKANIDSFLGIAYGSYSLDEKNKINAQVAAGYNRTDSSRYINFGGLSRVAKGKYDGWNLHVGSGISHLENLNHDTTIAPQLRLDYFMVANQSYNETGAGALNLHVASQNQAQLIPAAEVQANHKFTPAFSLALNAGLGYDLLNNRNTVNASFEDGSGEFITRGLAPSPWVVRSGAGLIWKQSDELDLTARYDRRDRGNYINQTISLKLRQMF
ncbi:MAG: outer rane autotransporter [Rickettsiaceae bacterium]|jgi:uncharacterized protein with beta-barrel porin domain|nr:outer rane autotransporter [Rickettsiaceae bacterium]